MSEKILILFLLSLNLCRAQTTNDEYTIYQTISVNRNSNNFLLKEIQINYGKKSIEYNLTKVKEYNILKFEEFVSDSVKVPVTYEIDYDTDNPIADNEIEKSLISNRLSFIKKAVKYKKEGEKYTEVSKNSSNTESFMYNEIPKLNSENYLNTLFFKGLRQETSVDSIYTQKNNGGLIVNNFKKDDQGDSSNNKFNIKGQLIGFPFDKQNLKTYTQPIQNTVYISKSYEGYLICDQHGLIQEISLSVSEKGFSYTNHDGYRQKSFDRAFDVKIINKKI